LNLVFPKYGTNAVLLRNNYLLWHSISSKISSPSGRLESIGDVRCWYDVTQ
jgi:hypothetical protein